MSASDKQHTQHGFPVNVEEAPMLLHKSKSKLSVSSQKIVVLGVNNRQNQEYKLQNDRFLTTTIT